MVHGAQLEMPTIVQKLFFQLRPPYALANGEPTLRSRTLKERSSKYQRLRIGQQVIALQVLLQLLV